MDTITAVQLILLPVGALAVAGISRWRGWPAPLLLVLAGLIASLVPRMPEYELDPEIVLIVFLPPLLYSASLDSSYMRLRENRRAVALLSVGLVLVSTLVVGLAAMALIPALSLAAALAFGAIVAPPDAVAAVAVGRKLGLPRRVLTILLGESLFNDATALTAYRVAVAATMGMGFTTLGIAGQFAYSAGVGVAIGLALAYVTGYVLQRIADALVANAISLLIPYVAYVAAEIAHASGVIAVVIVGIYLGHVLSRTVYATRLLSNAVWQVLDFLLESIVFALIGLQLWPIWNRLPPDQRGDALLYAVILFLVAVLVRVLWMPCGAYIPRLISPRIRRREPPVPWRHLVVVSWAGMRGVVSLAAAYALPDSFPERELVQFLTFAVVIGTLVVQGLSFPWLIRKLGVSNEPERYEDNLREAGAQQAAAAASLARLEEMTADGVSTLHQEIVDQLRSRAERRALHAWERLGGGTAFEGEETPAAAYRRLRREMLAAEREVFIGLRDRRRIDDEVLHRVLKELDFEEATLERD
ncbi:Na+/H+ antiporter [Streptosporangiaceae bacterium NEAU-GS5]|nr:Na+/H+ antiporter [Streptosporangiaceae bacterium NEAU-GS5]